jgi:hypothetical protein
MANTGEPVELSDLMVDMNERVRALAARLHESIGEQGDEWGFMCECGLVTCHERVHLSLPAYEALRTRGDAVLAAGHVLTEAQRARRRAERLSGEASALRAQAELQTKRARRNTSTQT